MAADWTADGAEVSVGFVPSLVCRSLNGSHLKVEEAAAGADDRAGAEGDGEAAVVGAGAEEAGEVDGGGRKEVSLIFWCPSAW